MIGRLHLHCILIALACAFLILFSLRLRIDKLEDRVNKLYNQRTYIDKTYAIWQEDRGYEWGDDDT